MLKNEMVDLPSKGVVKQKGASATYIYHILRSYRDEKGRPTNDRVCIGKLDIETGKLIPNQTYFSLYDTPEIKKDNNISTIQTKGVTEFVDTAIEKSSLSKILKKVFPTNYKKILLIATYMLSQGNVMQYIDSWCEQNATEDNMIISSQEVSKLFESITYEDRMKFFQAMSAARVENEFIAYDVTSVSSYSSNIDSVEWGYNRDCEDLAQINIGLYYGEQSKLPLFYTKYPGSINDKAHMKHMISNNDLINLNQVKFVMDKGFYSKENIQELNSKGFQYIIAIPNNLKIVQQAIQKHRDDIVFKSECKLGADLPYAKGVINHDYGAKLKMCIYYNQNKANDEIERFLSNIDTYEKHLKLNEENKRSSYRKYFNVAVEDGKNTEVKRKVELIDEKIKQLGFFILLTTEHGLSELEILNIYRNKDVVEKSFNNLKNDIDMKRLRTHQESTTDGKLFVAFISLIIRSYTYERLRAYMKKNNLTYTGILKELEKIKQVTFLDNSFYLSPLTKRQREIFECL